MTARPSSSPVIPLDYVIALSAGARKLSDFISDRLFVQMTSETAYDLAVEIPFYIRHDLSGL